MEIIEVQGTRCIVRPVRTPLKQGKIYLPVTSVKNTQVGKVLFVGNGCVSEQLKPGAIVIFDHLAGVILDKEKNWLVLEEKDLMAIVENYQQGEIS